MYGAFTSHEPFTFTTKTEKPRDFPKVEPFLNPFSKEGIERHNEKMKKEAEDKQKFVESLDLAFAKFEKEKKEVCIISLDNLKLEEEVKAHDDDDNVEEDCDNFQEEELLDEVSALPYDKETKETEKLV